MSLGRFAALRDSSSSSEEGEEESALDHTSATAAQHVFVPAYEDLSTSRADEVTVLSAVYGSDFRREEGTWGCALLKVNVRPPDLQQERIGCELTLAVQLVKQYPYVPPTVEFLNVKGLSSEEQATLMSKIKERASELAETGTVMVIELVQIAEDFLVEHNHDPTMSAWEQMKAREAKEKAEREKTERRWMEQSSDQSVSHASFPHSHEDFSNMSGRARLVGMNSSAVEKELARQRSAIDAAKHHRSNMGGLLMRRLSSDGNDVEDGAALEDDDDEDWDDDQAPPPIGSASRYETDFIELGILGRGGGGEVVKVRNRLDRRICK